MKSVLKSCTLWFSVISLLIIFFNIYGMDLRNMLLIEFNPLLSMISNIKPLDTIMNSGFSIYRDASVFGPISIYWYFANLISFVFYGAIIDAFRLWLNNLYEDDGLHAVARR